MQNVTKITKLLFAGLLSAGMVMPPAMGSEEWTKSPSLPRTLLRRSEHQTTNVPSKAIQPPDITQVLPAQVSIFYPTMGQSTSGVCWQGLRIDSNDNVYPIGFGQISKILPDGTQVNGVRERNYFASSDANSYWAELDENSGKFYMPAGSDVLVAPFVEGSTFSLLDSGLSNGQAITLGQGSLAGSLFVTDTTNQVIRVALSPPELSVFASGSAFFNFPEAITSAPSGTLYTANIGFDPAQLTKVTPASVPSTFAVGADPLVNRAVITDRAGNIYWSSAKGINKYNKRGQLLGTLPGPPDKLLYENLMGSAFDSQGNLYFVENFDCKKIYKYTLEP